MFLQPSAVFLIESDIVIYDLNHLLEKGVTIDRNINFRTLFDLCYIRFCVWSQREQEPEGVH